MRKEKRERSNKKEEEDPPHFAPMTRGGQEKKTEKEVDRAIIARNGDVTQSGRGGRRGRGGKEMEARHS